MEVTLTQAVGLIGLGAGGAFVLLGGIYVAAQRFIGHETKGLTGRVESTEKEIDNHDERLRAVENDISSIKTSVKSIDKKLNNFNGR